MEKKSHVQKELFPETRQIPVSLEYFVGKEIIQPGFDKDERSKLVLRISFSRLENKILRQLLLEKQVNGKKLYKPVNGRLICVSSDRGIQILYILTKQQGQTTFYDPAYTDIDRLPLLFPVPEDLTQKIIDTPNTGYQIGAEIEIKEGNTNKYFS